MRNNNHGCYDDYDHEIIGQLEYSAHEDGECNGPGACDYCDETCPGCEEWVPNFDPSKDTCPRCDWRLDT